MRIYGTDPRGARRARHMQWAWLFACAIAIVSSGCSDDDTTEPPESFAPPTDLVVVNSSNEVNLSWDETPDQGLGDFQGYNVYRHTSSMAGMTSTQLRTYLLPKSSSQVTVAGQVEQYRDATAVNGTRYYYRVVAVKGGDFDDFSQGIELDTAPRPEFDSDTVYEFAAANQPSGLRLQSGNAFRMTSQLLVLADNRDSIDVYIGTSHATDGGSGTLRLKSPHLVDNSDSAWAGRDADIMYLGNSEDAWDAYAPEATGWADFQDEALTEGAVFAVRTPDGHYAKLRVIDVDGTAPQRQVRCRIAYQPLPNYPRF